MPFPAELDRQAAMDTLMVPGATGLPQAGPTTPQTSGEPEGGMLDLEDRVMDFKNTQDPRLAAEMFLSLYKMAQALT